VQELQALGDAVGTVSKGVPQAVVDALSRSRYSMPAAAASKQGARRRSKGSRSPQAEPDKCGTRPASWHLPAVVILAH